MCIGKKDEVFGSEEIETNHKCLESTNTIQNIKETQLLIEKR